MVLSETLIKELAIEVVKRSLIKERNPIIPVGVSNRHIHLSQEDLDSLFGNGYKLTVKKQLKQPGQFAANESVTILGPKGSIANVRVLGPVRKKSQIEISSTDGYMLGVKPPLRNSGDLTGAASLSVIGPKGIKVLDGTVICANRHIHMNKIDAGNFGIQDKDEVDVETFGDRGAIFKNVFIRVSQNASLEFHIDTDEANAAQIKNGDFVRILRRSK